jgi:hypothetical protein
MLDPVPGGLTLMKTNKAVQTHKEKANREAEWLTPLILTCLKVEIRKIAVQVQPRQKKFTKPISICKRSWAWWCAPVIPAT